MLREGTPSCELSACTSSAVQKAAGLCKFHLVDQVRWKVVLDTKLCVSFLSCQVAIASRFPTIKSAYPMTATEMMIKLCLRVRCMRLVPQDVPE
jgi:hypothetical protein